MKKALIIVLIIISFRLVFSGQTAGEAGAGGYGCPVSETTGGIYAVRSVQGANFGCNPSLVSSCTPLSNDELNFCKTEANNAIQGNFCNWCTLGTASSYGSYYVELTNLGPTAGSNGPCQGGISNISQTDCGALCFPNLQCTATAISNIIIEISSSFISAYNNFLQAEQKYSSNLKTYFTPKLIDSFYEPTKQWLIAQAASNYVPPLNSKITVAEYSKSLERHWPKFFANLIQCNTGSTIGSNGDNPIKRCIDYDNPKKYISNIYSILVGDYDENVLASLTSNPFFLYCLNNITVSFAQTQPTIISSLKDSIKDLCCFFLPVNSAGCPAASFKTSGFDYINQLIGIFFSNSSSSLFPTLNSTVLNMSVTDTYNKNLKTILNNADNLALPPIVTNSGQISLFGTTFAPGTYIPNFRDLSNSVIQLFSVNSPLIKLFADYNTNYLTQCNKCVVTGTQMSILGVSNQLDELGLFIAAEKGFGKGDGAKAPEKAPEKAGDPVNSGDPPVETPADPAAPADPLKPVNSGDPVKSVDPAGGTGAEAGDAEEAAGEGAAGPLMVAYMIGTSICSALKPNEAWCDPVGEILKLDTQMCTNLGQDAQNSASGWQGDARYYTSQLLNPACSFQFITQQLVAHGTTWIGDLLCLNAPASVDNAVSTASGVSNTVSNDVSNTTSTCAKYVTEGLNAAFSFIGKTLSSFTSTIGDIFTGSPERGKGNIQMPWEKPGASGEEIAEGATAEALLGPVLEIIRRSENTGHGCGTTGSNWNHGGCYYSHYLCCKASSDYQPNSACSGVFQNGGWYRAC